MARGTRLGANAPLCDRGQDENQSSQNDDGNGDCDPTFHALTLTRLLRRTHSKW